ncbi:unknown [Prevotella sp. CAG:485]|nr:unknown [Prevotella sp. CAG:485]
MILHYLHSAHIFVAYAVGGYPVFAAEKVGSFNIELVYVLALILDFAALRHIYAGHTFQHIAYCAVLRLRKTTHIV